VLAHEDALAVIEDRRAEVEAELEGAGGGDGHAGQQDVEFAALKGGKALLRRGGGELHLVGRAEDGDGKGPAEIDEEALPLAVAVGREEARRGADADLDGAALVDLVQRRAGMGETRKHGGGKEGGGRSRLNGPPEGFLSYHIEMSPFSKRAELPRDTLSGWRGRYLYIIYIISVFKERTFHFARRERKLLPGADLWRPVSTAARAMRWPVGVWGGVGELPMEFLA